VNEPTLDRERFTRLWSALGGGDARVFDELAQRYSAPDRHYHSTEHIVECLGWVDRARDLCRDADALEAAVWFHDAVHDPLAGDNEVASAGLFRAAAGASGISAEKIDRVCTLIAATDHRRPEVEGDARLLVDIDLSILGAPPVRYRRYERDVRAEYAALSDAVFQKGRLAVLRGFLERTMIFRTPYFYDRLERQARENLAEALRALA
jgi:predicted metal-dependent HD superfamily phosphohydrolase